MGSIGRAVAVFATTAILCIHCGGSTGSEVLGPAGAEDASAGSADGASSSGGDGGSTTTDGSSGNDARPNGGDAAAGAPCTPSSGGSGGDSCGDGLSCLCCGSAGPKEVCLCTTSCTGDSQCKDPSRSTCNQVKGQPGICTPLGFNCCWLCQ